jgi:hypothetical protein
VRGQRPGPLDDSAEVSAEKALESKNSAFKHFRMDKRIYQADVALLSQSCLVRSGGAVGGSDFHVPNIFIEGTHGEKFVAARLAA